MTLLIEYMSNNMVFFGILFGSIGLTVFIYLAYSHIVLKKPKRHSFSEPTISKPKSPTNEPMEDKSESKVEAGIKVVDGEIATVFKAEQDPIHPFEATLDTNTDKEEPAEEESSDESMKEVDSPIESNQENLIPKEIKKPLGKYHVMFRQSDQKWIVKRENSSKIVRSLETQKEAISYATIKALTNDTTVVIHKKDGKIRKQNYSKSSPEDETEK